MHLLSIHARLNTKIVGGFRCAQSRCVAHGFGKLVPGHEQTMLDAPLDIVQRVKDDSLCVGISKE